MSKINTLIDEQTLQNKVTEIAKKIEEDYKDKEIVFICILKGSIFFMTDLAKQIKNKIQLEFIKASSYGENLISSGEVNIELDLMADIEGKDVIMIEDIIDTGNTLSFMIEHIKEKNPKTLKLCTLLDKEERREKHINIDYTGFVIPDKFVIGYGLDFNEEYRNLSYIGYLN